LRCVRRGLHSVWLAAVLVHASVDRVDDIRADRCLYEVSIFVQQLQSLCSNAIHPPSRLSLR
jgi:hypothetical protein